MSKRHFTLQELAQLTQSTLWGDALHTVCSFDELSSATTADVSFLSNPRYKEAMKKSCAGIICIDESTDLIPGKNFLISKNPSHVFQLVINLLLESNHLTSGFQGIHPTAVIHESATIGQNVTVGPHVVINQGASIGDNTIITASSYIGSSVKVGSSCLIHPNVTVREGCVIGNRVILQPGAVIGSCGFGYITNAQGIHEKVEQLGIVVLEDDVEIGANTTIDRARFKETRISKGTKIDNLVQIGHNVHLGEHNIIVSQTGIAGSAKTGKYVVMGGQTGVVGHITIADHCQIATRGGVSKSVTQAGQYGGSPIVPFAEYQKQRVHKRRIGEYAQKIAELEKRLASLENKS